MTLFYELLLLITLITGTSAFPSLWSVEIDEGPAPPVDRVPPIARKAIRNRVALQWQIPTIIGSYLAFLLLTITVLCTVARRKRNQALMNRQNTPLDLIKAPERTFGSDPASPQSTRSLRKLASSVKERFASKEKLHDIDDPAVDQRVVSGIYAQRSERMQRVYAAALADNEDMKDLIVVDERDIMPSQCHSENWQLHQVSNIDTIQQPQLYSGDVGNTLSSSISQIPLSPLRDLHSRAQPSASSITLNSITSARSSHTQASGLPETPHPKRDEFMYNHGTSPSSSRNMRALRISTAVHPTSTASAHSATSAISKTSLTPMTPLRSHPTSPVVDVQSTSLGHLRNTIRSVEQSPSDDLKTSLMYIREEAQEAPPLVPSQARIHVARITTLASQTTPYLDRPLPPRPDSPDGQPPSIVISTNRESSKPGRAIPAQGIHGSANASTLSVSSTDSTNRQLPFRSYNPPILEDPISQGHMQQCKTVRAPLRSPNMTRLTLVTPRPDRQGLRDGELTAGPPVPYSAKYMPGTPMTPITPGLQTRQARKAKEKAQGRRPLTAEDLVPDDAELWGEEYK